MIPQSAIVMASVLCVVYAIRDLVLAAQAVIGSTHTFPKEK
jgi:hypothetical protein